MTTESPSTIQGDMSSFAAESIALGQTGHLRDLDMLLRPASPTSEVWNSESQYNDACRRKKYTPDETAESPTVKAQTVFAPSNLDGSGYFSSRDDDKENCPPGLVFQVAVSDTCHRVEANGTIDSGHDQQVEMEFGFPVRMPVKVTIQLSQCSPPSSSRNTRQRDQRNHDGNSEIRTSERRRQTSGPGHKRQRIYNIRRNKRPVMEEC
ncbi:hypothetical protein HRG_000763 [Hirsutella rhossiliensis]|uniref:Uncharacterized protein n=1 Tax=Hirsutella rhossiliensis TaxID=111463 RepID=A0A9P8SPE1_9HYPO|nr:uncharacterized protein HRG_00763 [Hirsutella rhossiliensis]KAH0968121.1 hypothetical protein HRG_00763 [Hirsutella rhossiliensis]